MFLESSSSDLIKELQNLLNARGAGLKVTGTLDTATADAVKKYYPQMAHLVDMPDKPSTDTTKPTTQSTKEPTAKTTSTPSRQPSSKTSTNKGNAFGDKEFVTKLKRIANSLRIDPDDLAAIIHVESRGRPDAVNKFDVSVGLIGFTKKTAESLGTTKEDLRRMPAIEQLDYVEKFYRRIGVKPGMDRGQIYMLTFLPAFVNAPSTTVLGKENGGDLMLPNGRSTKLSMHKIWQQNPVFGLSQNKSFFTVGDVKRHINSIPAPSLAEDIGEDTNPVDTVQLDVPLLLRMMEYAREDAKTDMDLHDVTEKMIHLSKTGETLSMDQYDDIVGDNNNQTKPKPTMPGLEPAQQEAMGGSSAEEFLKSVEYRPRHQAKPKRTLMGDPVREGHGRYWCSTDKRWKERQGPKQSRS